MKVVLGDRAKGDDVVLLVLCGHAYTKENALTKIDRYINMYKKII